MSIDRTRAAVMGQETLRIINDGSYTTEAGVVVEIGSLLQRAIAGTQSYPPQAALPVLPTGAHTTRIEVTNESTLAAAYRLAQAGAQPVALNFASAKNPGGGFLSGARAQEESLARASGLYACIAGNEMYARHRASRDLMYTNSAIYSPGVPIFRDDDGQLLDQPYCCAFITSPAVNAKEVLRRDPSRRAAIRLAMEERMTKVLAIAAAHNHEALVLGAWGCGVFGNDPQEIAELFGQALHGSFEGVFATVVFAILDWSAEQRFIGPFQRCLG